ncbi:MAG: TIGR03620 family F420-dependent LLM class oxidoreductase [Acidimicrobiales bacterium]
MNLGAFGIWWSGWQADDGLEAAAGELEALGYGAIWMSGGFSAGLTPRFGSVLDATTSIVVASGIVNTWLTPAADLAAATAALNSEHGGRFLLGLGASHAPIVEGNGQPYVKPFSQVAGFLDELDACEPPVGKDDRILAALGPRMLRLAADRSLGAHPYFTTAEHTASARQLLGPDAILAPEVAVVLSTDPTEAREKARHYMAGYLGLPNYVGNLRRIGWSEDDLADGGSTKLVDALVPWGAPGTVAERLRQHRDAGADHVCIQVVGGGGAFPIASYGELAPALGLH